MTLTRSSRAERIAQYACEACGVTKSDIKSKSKHGLLVRARRIAAYCIRRTLNYGWHDIAPFAGYHSHNSAVHANAAAEKMVDPEHENYDEDFAVTCEAIIQRERIDFKNDQMREAGGIGARRDYVCAKCRQLSASDIT